MSVQCCVHELNDSLNTSPKQCTLSSPEEPPTTMGIHYKKVRCSPSLRPTSLPCNAGGCQAAKVRAPGQSGCGGQLEVHVLATAAMEAIEPQTGSLQSTLFECSPVTFSFVHMTFTSFLHNVFCSDVHIPGGKKTVQARQDPAEGWHGERKKYGFA